MMEKTWRWFGKKDKITLSMLRQIGVEGIVTALHEVPNGEIWTVEAINDLKQYIESYGMRWSVVESLPVCEEYGVNMCVHPDDPPFQILGLPRIVTNEEDIDWFLHAVDNPHNGLTFCAGSLSAGEHNDTRELARKFAKRTHFVHLRSTAAMPGGNFIESSHLSGRGHLIDLIRIFEQERPGLPMRVDHGRMMLGDEDKGYNPGYSFHGRMLALAQVEGMMAVVEDELKRGISL